MKIFTYKDYETLSENTAEIIVSLVNKKPDAVLCFASGDTPIGTYKCLVKKHLEKKVDFSQCTFIGLDEWLGVPPDNPGSCNYFHIQNFLKPLKISPDRTRLFDAMTADPHQECKAMDEFIFKSKGIDLMLVGTGMNGHVGFNEPGISQELYSHVIDLDTTTISVGQKYFSEPIALKKGITLGLKHLLEARAVILIASGLKKANIIQLAFQHPPTPSLPASILQLHPHSQVLLDEDAASLFTQR